MRRVGGFVLAIVAVVLVVFAWLPAEEVAGGKNNVTNDLECPIIYGEVDTVFKDKDTGALTLASTKYPHYTGTVYTSGSNWWTLTDREPRGIAIFDLNDAVLPEDSKVMLGLGDAGFKLCDDPSDCGNSPQSPNAISISAFTAKGPNVVVGDWATSASRLTVLTTDPGQHLPISEPYYYVDVTDAVVELLKNVENGERYLGLKFEATKASDYEDLSMSFGNGVYSVQLQVIADPKRIVETALDAEETYDNYIVTKQGEIVVDGPRIEMRFQPTCGNEQLALKTLEKALNIDHFNWEQTIELPSNWTSYVAGGVTQGSGLFATNIERKCQRLGDAVNSLKYLEGPLAGEDIQLSPISGVLYDPILISPAGSDQFQVVAVDGPDPDDLCWFPLPLYGEDNYTPYYIIPNEAVNHTSTYVANFADEPYVENWSLMYGSDEVNQFIRFSTSLVGVSNGQVIVRSKPVEWKSNAHFVRLSSNASGGVGQFKPVPYFLEIFPQVSGGIFDLNPPGSTPTPGDDYSIHFPMVIQ